MNNQDHIALLREAIDFIGRTRDILFYRNQTNGVVAYPYAREYIDKLDHWLSQAREAIARVEPPPSVD